MSILSEVVITLYDFSLVLGLRNQIFISLAGTILFALSFIHLQKFEYSNTPFCFSDSVYGLIFYSTTGSHVIIKTCLNWISSLYPSFSYFTPTKFLVWISSLVLAFFWYILVFYIKLCILEVFLILL